MRRGHLARAAAGPMLIERPPTLPTRAWQIASEKAVPGAPTGGGHSTRDRGVACTGSDWSRSNRELWEGRAMIAGRISKSSMSVLLTGNVIKRQMRVPLTPEEERAEEMFSAG